MKLVNWIKKSWSHKIEKLRPSNLAKFLRTHGLAFVVIVVLWELIEDVLFPLLFLLLGNNVHPAFYSGIPVSWLFCLHWVAVPVLWMLWTKISGKKLQIDERDRKIHVCHEHDHPK